MTCAHPENSPLHGYRKGCRCERCRAAKSAVDKRRDRTPKIPCPSCNGRKAAQAVLCMSCRYGVPPVDRVMAKVSIDLETECWIFQGNRNRGGYGQISVAGSGRVCHRVTYEHHVGLVPDGLELDHLCNRPSCCNPDHLEPVTHLENVRRAYDRRAAALWREATS